jgi:hypothetical protein
MQDDDFFIGYRPTMPEQSRRALRAFVGACAVFVVGVGTLLASLMNRPAAAEWDFGAPTSHHGLLLVRPYPVLIKRDEHGAVVSALLVAAGKHGAAEMLAPFDGQSVEVIGTVLRRDRRLMIEIADAKHVLADRADPPEAPPAEDLGQVTLAGQIVDPKCYMGAMKPGEGKIHRACAVRCISGGIPPVLVSPGPAGPEYYILTGQHGQAVNRAVLDYVADSVEISGRLIRRADLQYLEIDPDQIRRIE